MSILSDALAILSEGQKPDKQNFEDLLMYLAVRFNVAWYTKYKKIKIDQVRALDSLLTEEALKALPPNAFVELGFYRTKLTQEDIEKELKQAEKIPAGMPCVALFPGCEDGQIFLHLDPILSEKGVIMAGTEGDPLKYHVALVNTRIHGVYAAIVKDKNLVPKNLNDLCWNKANKW